MIDIVVFLLSSFIIGLVVVLLLPKIGLLNKIIPNFIKSFCSKIYIKLSLMIKIVLVVLLGSLILSMLSLIVVSKGEKIGYINSIDSSGKIFKINTICLNDICTLESGNKLNVKPSQIFYVKYSEDIYYKKVVVKYEEVLYNPFWIGESNYNLLDIEFLDIYEYNVIVE